MGRKTRVLDYSLFKLQQMGNSLNAHQYKPHKDIKQMKSLTRSLQELPLQHPGAEEESAGAQYSQTPQVGTLCTSLTPKTLREHDSIFDKVGICLPAPPRC